MNWICPQVITATIDRQLGWWEQPVAWAATLFGAEPRRWCDLIWWPTVPRAARDRILSFAVEDLVARQSGQSQAPPRPGLKHACPVCRVPLLAERGRAVICQVCWWEDDGIDDEDWPSGCNRGITLAEARRNFAQTMWHLEPGDPLAATLGAGVPDLEDRRRGIVELAARMQDIPEGPELTESASELDRRVHALGEAWFAWSKGRRNDAATTLP